jgi:GTP pyrophosphokinase
MGRRLDLAVKNLVHAERAAATAPATSNPSAREASTNETVTVRDAPPDSPPQREPDPRPGSGAGEAKRRRLIGIADTLAKGLAAGRSDRKLARATWREHASEAERRGDMGLAARLEDLALRTLYPEAYAELALRLQVGREKQRTWANQQEAALTRLLGEAGCAASTVEHRVKSTASVYRKMRAKGLEFDEVHDLFAFRVVVPTERECYLALGVIHRSFEPLLGRFSDYIASPKPSGYRSLHTIVRPNEPDAPIFEIQIPSAEMHSLADHGSAAHWRYKRGPESSHYEAVTSD